MSGITFFQDGSHEAASAGDDHALAAAEGTWQFMDGVMSIYWALRWAAYAADDTAEDFIQFWETNVRSNPSLQSAQIIFHAAQWKIAVEMREGATWDNAFRALQKDNDWMKIAKNTNRWNNLLVDYIHFSDLDSHE